MWPRNSNIMRDHTEKKARRDRIRIMKDASYAPNGSTQGSTGSAGSQGEIISHGKWLEKYGRLKEKYVKLRERITDGEIFKRKLKDSEEKLKIAQLALEENKKTEAMMKNQIKELMEKLEASTEMILDLKNKEENLEAHNKSMSTILNSIPEYSYYGEWHQ